MKKYVIGSLLAVGLGILALGYIAYRTLATAPPTPLATVLPSTDPETLQVRVGTTSIVAELAKTPADMRKGLSGRVSLADGQGMLFLMGTSDRHRFWMPDMYFAIDIIWIDENLTVVDLTTNATPESYPAEFSPRVPARYVLEVPAGYALRHTIEVGQEVVFTP